MNQIKLSEDQIFELCKATTRDDAGRHFSEWMKHYEELENMGLIRIDRPVHSATGIAYEASNWTLELTQSGLEAISIDEAYQLGRQDAAIAKREALQDGSYKRGQSSDWDSGLINAIGTDATARKFGCDPESELFAKCCKAYNQGCIEAWDSEEIEFDYQTDAESGTITAKSFREACGLLHVMLTEKTIEDGAWGWVEDIDGYRYEIGESN